MGLVKFKSNKTGELVDVDFPLHPALLEVIHADGSKTQSFRTDFVTEFSQQAPEIAPVDATNLEQQGDVPPVLLAPPVPPATKGAPPLPTAELLTAFGRIRSDVAAVVSEGHAKLLEEIRAGHQWTGRIESMIRTLIDNVEKLHEGHALLAKLMLADNAPPASSVAPKEG